MTINEIIQNRAIKEILHFTTHRGITGILATGALKARSLLSKEEYLEYIYRYNCPPRQNIQAWYGYVNLSLTSVNRHLFKISTGKWHANENGWWCVLSFKPEICSHKGVYFTTTNNMYTGVKRQKGYKGLESIFDPFITQWTGNIVTRSSSISNDQPTCQQAEVLYPREVSLDYLIKVYVENDEDASRFESIKVFYPNWREIPCEVNEKLFI